jgi:hypothetical protein
VVHQDASVLADGGTNPLRPITLVTPDTPATRGLIPHAFAAAIAGTGRWISAQTFGPQGVRGPALVYERRSDGPWVPASIPATTRAFYPALCAVTATEAYVAVSAGTGPAGAGAAGRIFARAPGEAAMFVEQTAPTPAGYNVEAWGLSCFPGGDLWVYGTIYPVIAPASRRTVIYHRSSTTSGWQSVSLPPQAATATGGKVIAMIRADGSGYFAMSHLSGRHALFERLPDGSWQTSLVLDTGDSVASLAGDPGAHALGAVNALDAKYVELRQGSWSVRPATGFASLRGASRSPRGLMVTGATQAGPVEFRMAVAREPDFVPLQLGLEGTVSQVVFPAGANEPALVVTYGAPSLITAYEWSPGQEWEKAHTPPPPPP